MKALCICEKPSLMREIKNVYDKINFRDQIDFIALHGHILSLYLPDDYDEKYASWDKSLLPIFPERWLYKATDKKLLNEIKSKLKNGNYDYLINATDAEREGQNIFHSIYSHLNLKMPVKRIWLNDLNFVPIKNAIENMRDDLNDPFLVNLTKAAKCRTFSDWLVGMNFTRAVGISVGRVKTPTLEILYKRELEIKNYVPSVCYYPEADFGFLTKDSEHEFKTSEECEDFIIDELYDKLKNGRNINGKVLFYSGKEKKEYAPKLFSLGELQIAASSCFGYTLEQTLSIAQSLYEKKITTYPRTDCPYLTTGDAARIPGMINMLFGIVGKKFNLATTTVPSKYVDDSKVQAHSAIIFTGSQFDMNSLSKEEKNIVDLIARRIIAILCEPKVFFETKVDIDINGYTFKGTYLSLTSQGFDVTSYKPGIVSANLIPKLNVGDLLPVKDINPRKKESTRPSRYNDGTLIKAMINIGNTLSSHEKEILKGVGDQGGIGTPATRSGIVEGLIDSKWVVRKNSKSFEVTDEGMRVAEALSGYSFASASLTASWEEKLSEIVNGTYNYGVYYNEMKKYVADQTKELIQNSITTKRNSKGVSKLQPVCKCVKCGKNIIETQKGFSCEGFFDESCNFGITKNAFGANITAKDFKDLCEKGETKVMKMHSARTGKDFNAKIVLDADTKPALSFDTNSSNGKKVSYSSNSAKCSCSGNLVAKNGKFGKYYECDKCGVKISTSYCGHNFTDAEMSKLFKHEKVKGKFHSSAKNKDFEANIYLDADYKFKFDFN